MASPPIQEGEAPFTVDGETFSTYYKLVGDLSASPQPPLVVLHGGPGVSHDYLLPLADLAHPSPPSPDSAASAAPAFPAIPVLFYDQLGTARSTHLPSKPPAFWSIALFVAELESLLAHLGIDARPFDLLGHSWGGILAAEFVVRRQPPTLRRLVLADTLASARLRNEAGVRLRRGLPEDVQEVLRRHEEAGTTREAEYKQAMLVFYKKHLCRIQPFPEELLYSFKQPELDDTVLKNMRKNGLEDEWDITARIPLIRAPTLLLNGEHDFETDDVCAPFFRALPKVKWVKFAHSAHMPHWEERERYMRVVGAFLRDE